MLIAFETNVLKWPGMNEAFLFSFFLTTALSLLVIPYSKRRPKGTPTSWGEAMLASVFTFGVMFVAFGVVPHQFIDHADKELGWTKNLIIYGPGDILKPKALGGPFPFTMSYEAIRDIVVVVIHLWYFGLMIFLWHVWQKRGDAKPSTEVATSTFGRPLVKKG
ncbi:MAG: hypothetical protein Q7V57_11695 [Actinomycetota bacterium]|nr:hypothetical protein [Actinomycetota bacterium]